MAEAHFVTISHWRTLTFERYGSSPSNELYRLAPVTRPAEGAFFRMFFDGKITEFALLRKKVALEEPQENSGGFKLTHLRIKFWLERTSHFYLLKAFTHLFMFSQQ